MYDLGRQLSGFHILFFDSLLEDLIIQKSIWRDYFQNPGSQIRVKITFSLQLQFNVVAINFDGCLRRYLFQLLYCTFTIFYLLNYRLVHLNSKSLNVFMVYIDWGFFCKVSSKLIVCHYRLFWYIIHAVY